MKDIKSIISKRLDAVTAGDINIIKAHLDTISNWPWVPKDILKIKNAGDLEFTTRSPELVNFLCNYIEFLFDIIQQQALNNEGE